MSQDVWECLYWEVFYQCHFLGDITFLWQPLSSFMLMPLAFTKSLQPHDGLFDCSKSTFPGPAVSSLTPCVCCWNFTPSVTTLHFFVALASLWANSLSVTHFCKISHGLFTGREGSNTTTHSPFSFSFHLLCLALDILYHQLFFLFLTIDFLSYIISIISF